MRNPKRTAASASALMIGVGVVGLITIFVSSTKASMDAAVDRAFTGDIVVDSAGGLFRGRGSRAGQEARRAPRGRLGGGPPTGCGTGGSAVLV
jgi:putative ABC transport system permease protein